MLREVFKSKSPVYETYSEYADRGGRFILGFDYHYAKAPNVEANFNPLGLTAVSAVKDPVPIGASTLYLLGRMSANYWPSSTQAIFVFDGKTGRFVRRHPAVLGLVSDFSFWGPMFTSRLGVHYVRPPGVLASGNLVKIIISPTAVIVTDAEGNIPAENIFPPSKFEGMSRFGAVAIDDDLAKNDGAGGTLLNGTGVNFGVWQWTSGEFKYTLTMPSSIVGICLADANQCYILLVNRSLVLFDYQRGEVMGIAQVPPQESGAAIYQNLALAWDPIYRRVLLSEESPDNPDGSSTTIIRGFQMVNNPLRITRPIPLRVPRQGRVIPVLVQVVDELNQGVGIYAIESTVTGYGSLAGIPVADHRGDGLINVAIIGHPLYKPYEPPVLPEVPDVGVPAIGKSCWVGWIEFTPDLAYEPPGNSILNLAVSLVMKDIEGGDIGTFIQRPTVEEIEEMVQDTVGPAIAYLPERVWPRYPALRPGDWLCIHAFCMSFEDLLSFEVNMRAVIDAIPPTYQIAIVCQCSMANEDYTTNLTGLVPIYARLARDYVNVTMLLVSFDQGFSEGLASHPEVKPYWEDLYSGVPGAPVVLAAEAEASPPVAVPRIDSYDYGLGPLPIGMVNVTAKVTILGPGITESEGLVIIGTPGPPGGGKDFTTGLPETAPNMRYVLTQVYESQEWKLKDVGGGNGRGAFVDRAVKAIHDIDAKFGYEKSFSGRAAYKGHTADSLVYKSADGITGEVIKIVETEDSDTGAVAWDWESRDAAGLAKWMYANVSGSGDTGTGTDSGSPGGTAANPIIAMSMDAGQIVTDVTGSWNYFNALAVVQSPPVDIGTIAEWVQKCLNSKQLSNGKWYRGWNRYWEDLMDFVDNPGFPDTADPAHGSYPALHRSF